jgi:hypothetical protein
MAFETYSYIDDGGDSKPIRLTAETAAAGSFAIAASLDDSDFVKVSKSSREFGMRPRGVRARLREAGGRIRYKFFPMPTPAAQTAALNARTVNYNGAIWNVTAPVPEDV